MALNDLVCGISNHRRWFDFVVASVDVHSLEVVVFALVEVGQVPVDADVFQSQVIPLVGVRVVWHCVVMHVLATAPGASHSHKLTLIQLLGSAALIPVPCGNPATVDDNSRPFDLNRVSACKSILHAKFAAFVAVHGVDNVETLSHLPINFLLPGNKYFLGEIKLT